MMRHPDEHTIEMYILKPESLPEPVRSETAEHLSSCAACRAVEESLRSFHADFAQQGEADATRVAQLVARAFSSPRIYHLQYYRPRPHTSAGESYSGVLAAMTSDAGTRAGFETVASFASEPDHMLLRVRQDAAHRRVKVYCHADDPAMYAGAIISFPALSVDVVLDERGQMEFEIPEAKTSREWGTLEALVTLPLGILDIESPPAGEMRSGTIMERNTPRYSVTTNNQSSMVKIDVRMIGDAAHVRRVVVKDNTGLSVLVGLYEGHGTFSPLQGSRLLMRLYP